MRYSRKRVHPQKVVAGFHEVLKAVCVKKMGFQRTLFFLKTHISSISHQPAR